MNAVQHSPCANSAARGGVQRSLRHHRRLQRSMDLRALLRDKFTSPPPPKEHVPVRRQRHGKEKQKGYSHRKIKLQREREYKHDQANQNTTRKKEITETVKKKKS